MIAKASSKIAAIPSANGAANTATMAAKAIKAFSIPRIYTQTTRVA